MCAEGHEYDVLKGMEHLLRRTDLSFNVILELDANLQRRSGHVHQLGSSP